MTEEKFDEFLKKAAQGYNTPPARTPRDEMWTAIQAKRAAGPHVVYGGAGAAPQRRFGTRVWWSAAAAGLVLVATGIGIGRWTASSDSSAPTVTLPSAVASAPPTTTSESVGQEPRAEHTVPRDRDESPEASRAVVSPTNASRRASGGADVLIRRPVAATQVASACAVIRGCAPVISATGSEAADARNGAAPAYQLTTVRHLSDAEALLTSFRTRNSADHQMDAQLAKWARDLLTNTRLLLDSPVANDPQRRPLLEDLELVLVQIVQLSPGSTQQDHELIEKTLQQEHVLTRLRTAIPAGAQRGS
jgi:hypothetical protein